MAGLSLPTIVYVAPAVLCALAWFGLGSLVPARLLPDDRLLAALTRVAAGAGGYALASFLLGLAGLFRPWLFVSSTVVLAVPGAVSAARMLRDVRVPRSRAVRVLVALTALALLLDIVAASAPPTSGDALKYHLTVPERWLEIGRIDDPSWRWEAYGPFQTEMLYAQALALAPGGEAAGVVGALFGVLAAVAVAGLALALGPPRAVAAAAAAALFVLQGLVTWEATSAFVELTLTFYVVLAVWYALRAARALDALDVGWASFCAGGAAAAKFVGLMPAAVVLGLLGLVMLRARRLSLLAPLVIPALVLPTAWYVRNAVERSNPFFPLFFGGRGWSSFDHEEILNLDQYGPGGTPLRLVILPVDLLLHGNEFDRGRYVGVLILLFAALGLALRRTHARFVIGAGVLVYLVAWWTMSAQARFLLPPLAALAAIGGHCVADLLARGGLARRAAFALLGVAAAAWLAPSVALTRQLLPVAIGAESRAHAAQRLTGTYDALHAMAPRVDGVLGSLGYWFVFHYPGEAIALGPPDFGADDSRSILLRNLERFHVTHIVAPAGPGSSLQLTRLGPCLRRLATYDARYVTSRSLGESFPLPLVLYAVDYSRPGCTTR